MKHMALLGLVATSLVAAPSFAGPPAKRPSCQLPKSPARDVRRELCRKAPIPPLFDRTPMFLISTDGRPAAPSDLT
jgi:hypothetical protein